ncbi:beta strand repeat-containing protein, partial [Pedobacter sp. GR22-10]|uniref:beta strand repeat-containing protein n=1 Tax=Pedobacter sp. GR22-10 TaxID=2994472 RepID=UPI002248693F
MKKILLFITVLFCLCSLKGYAQIGYKFTRAQESIVTSGDVGSYISNLNKFTVEFWARPSANSNLMFTSIYVPGSAGQTELGGFGLYQNTLIVSIGSDFAGFSQSIDLGNRLSTVGWHHFAYVYNGADWLFYVDGSLISSDSDQEGLNGATPNYSGSGLTQFKIGGLSDGSTVTGALDYFDGNMDDFRVWNTARTQAQLSSNRTVELTGTETGLVLYYKLNEQSGQVVNNSTALSLNGVRGSTSGTETQDPAINQLGIVTGPPITTTNAATSITGAGAATLNGTVNENGGTATVSFDYSTNSTLSSGVTTVSATTGGTVNAGTGNTSSSVGLTGLTAGTTYYFRVKASNAGGSSNGSILNFTIPASSPTVSTDAVTSITTSSATMGGNVSAAGATAVSERGVVYATTINPTTSAAKALTGSGTGTFTGTVSGLSPATTYHVRAYAINTIGTSYGADQSFTTQAVTAQPTVASPSNGSLITTTAPNYTGTATAGATVTVYVDGASLGNTIATGGNWSLTQPTALAQGSHTVYATAQVSGNAVSANSTTNTFTIDSTRPSVVITSTAGASGSSTSTSPIPFTVTFSETVTGFVAGDITPGNTTISGFSGSGTTYTFNATPTTNGAVTISIAANVAQDAAGNGNTAASAFSITYAPATAAPVLIIPSNNGTTTSTKPAYAGTAPAGSIITIYVDGIALSNTTTATSGGNWAIFQPTDLGEGSHTVYATAQSSGNSVSANSNTNTFTVDSQRPSVVITSTSGASGSSTSTSPIPFTVTFSEAVTGFVAGDITPGNATLSGFSVSGTTYTFNATPTANGAVTMNIAANVAQDAAGNGNTAASQFSVTYAQANQAPIVTTTGGSNTFSGSQVVIDNGLTVADADNTTLSFATVGITGNFIAGEDILTYTNNSSALYGNITGSYNAGTGVLTLTSSGAIATVAQWQAALRSVAYNNTAGSPNTATRTISFTVNDGTANSNTATKNVTVINQATVTSIVRAASNPTNAAAVTYTVTFNKSVTGLSTTNFSITTSGTINGISPSVSGSGTTYTVTINTGTGSGTIRLNLANSTGISPSTITNLPFIGETYNIDKIAPSVTSVAVPANGTYTASQNLDFTVNFSEAVTVDATGGTPYIDVNLNTGGTVRANYISGSGTTAFVYRYTVASTDRDLDGIVLGALNINGATIRDAAGNDVNTTLNNVGSTAGVLVDGTPSLPQTITFNTLPAKTYGDADFDPGATSDNPGIPITYTSSNTSVATIVNGKIHIIAVGTSTITAIQTGDATHSAAANKQQTLTVNAKAITVTADAKTKNYGDADPALTYSITSGALVGADSFTGSLTRAAGENVGTYAINQGTLALNGNYTLTYIGADLTIGAKTVTVTAAAKSKTYGDA